MEASISHLLVPVDYSDKSIFGLKYAAKLNRVLNGKITFINVIKGVDPIWSEFFSDVEREVLLNRLKEHMRKFVHQNSGLNDAEFDCQILRGKLCDTIMQTAESLGASAIVMGTSRAENIKKKIIGTNALRVVSEAKCPVITIKSEPSAADIKRLILPMDISKESREKTVDAVAIAKRLNAEIMVVSAYTINDEFVLKNLRNQQNQVVKYIADRGVKCTGTIMVIITTHQQFETVSSFVGSFAKSMVSAAKVPVMSIVPRHAYNVVFKLPAS